MGRAAEACSRGAEALSFSLCGTSLLEQRACQYATGEEVRSMAHQIEAIGVRSLSAHWYWC